MPMVGSRVCFVFLKEGRFTHECLNVCLNTYRYRCVLFGHMVLDLLNFVGVVWDEGSRGSAAPRACRQIPMCVLDGGIRLQRESAVKK